MQEYELELAVGDAVQIGDCIVTVVDIEGTDISFRIDTPESDDAEAFLASSISPFRPPRK